MDLKLRVRQYITEQNMLEPGDHVIIGLSGGADSVCLLLILASLCPEMNLTLTALHVNHGIRGTEAEEDASFAEELCRRLQIPFRLCSVDIPALARERGMSLEEAGRQERYRLFREEAEHYPRVRIATAHHMDDQAETVLMNLCRGSGIRGMAGIAPVSGDLIRPLLCVRKEEIRAWLREQGQDWREDRTNRETEYTRNRIRQVVLPELTEHVNARTAEHMASLAEQARELDEWLDAEADRWIREYAEGRGAEHIATERTAAERTATERAAAGSSAGICFRKADLADCPKALRTRVLHLLLTEAAGRAKDLTARHLEAMDSLIRSDRGGSLDLPYELKAVSQGGVIRIGKMQRTADPDILLMPDVRTESLVFDRTGEKIPEKRYTKWFDYDRIKDTVLMRIREKDDVIAIRGVGHKPLRRYMIDAHIPAEIRDRIPVLACGNEVLWVVGYRMSAEYQVTETTKHILAVTVTAGDGTGEPGK